VVSVTLRPEVRSLGLQRVADSDLPTGYGVQAIVPHLPPTIVLLLAPPCFTHFCWRHASSL